MSQQDSIKSALQKLEPQKLKLILTLLERTKGKSMNEALPAIMEISSTMQKQQISFTPEERSILFTMLKSNMTPDEQRKLDMMQSLLARF